MSSRRKSWKFSQCFGDDGQNGQVSEADILSAVEFNHSGEYLATGDKGGCMCIFRRYSPPNSSSSQKSSGFWSKSPNLQYNFYAEFQSHEPEFDYLKSLEIEEKINKIRFCRHSNDSILLLSTNDKTIKLWKVGMNIQPKETKWTNSTPMMNGMITRPTLTIPTLTYGESVVAAYNRRKFENAHAYHINSISLCSDGETFISADDLRINMWNLNLSGQSFKIVDIKPENMEMLSEVITAAEYHPFDCNTFMYSSSYKTFFSEIIASISHVCFTPCGKYAVSRDYLKMKIWDTAMESKPVKVIDINEHLRPKLSELYENDCIFDKFEFAVGNNNARLRVGVDTLKDKKSPSKLGGFKFSKRRNSYDIDFSKKILHVAWNPHRDVCAIAAKSQLFMYGVF
eukprot:GSMAST32.ASY1.ANO1.1347.1 assembled CDS